MSDSDKLALAKFAWWAFEMAVLDGGDIGGDEVQEKMEELGIVDRQTYREEVHGFAVDPGEFEEGDPIYFLEDWIDRIVVLGRMKEKSNE